MKELLIVEGTQLHGKSSGGGILWADDDAHAKVMGLEHHGRVCGVGFGWTPSSKNARTLEQYTMNSPPSYEMSQKL